ncbi:MULTISPECIES: sigma-70 family RNA polymerase sigma factor [unclassified Sinorhizobium]|uniref:sigma-70 family RNA polymerase sigma factor n=1 Tax=unclassified Sinorhizobium TaxID=2613772 RepID=UPI0035254350
MEASHCDMNRNGIVNAMVEHKDKLLKTIENILKSRTLAEDVFQDGVVKAYGIAASDIRCPTGYAFRMVYNLALDESRRRKQQVNNHRSIETIQELGASVPTALDHLVAAETLHSVLASLEKLPKRTNEAFIRHRLNGVPQKDIAAELGVSRTLVNFMIKAAEEHCQLAIADPVPHAGLSSGKRSAIVSQCEGPAANRSTTAPALLGQRQTARFARSRRTG